MKSSQVYDVALDQPTLDVIYDMYYHDPVLVNARLSVLATVLHQPFTFSIPALRLNSSKDMEQVIERHYMPWAREAFGWFKIAGVIPYWIDQVGPHPVPRSPEFKHGIIKRVWKPRAPPQFKWFWVNDQMGEDKRVKFIIGSHYPDVDGAIRTPLVSLVRLYRSGVRILEAQDVAVTQCARPVHLMERRPGHQTGHATNDHLSQMTADFGARAVGLSRARRDEARVYEERQKQQSVTNALRAQEARQRNVGVGTLRKVLPTDTDHMLRSESDTGFGTRLFALPEDHVYREGSRPTMAIHYHDFQRNFNVLAAALMDFPMELLQPTSGTARTQSYRGAERFENDRIRELTNFFRTIFQTVVVDAYRPQFEKAMRNTTLEPTLDVEIHMSVSSNIDDEVLRRLHFEDGLLSQESMGKYLLRNHNIPLHEMELQPPEKKLKE